MKTLPAPGEPPIRQKPAQRQVSKGASRVAVSQRAFKELVYEYQSQKCSYCGIGLGSPSDKVPEGDRPEFLLRNPSTQDFPEGWLLVCPCCALEHDLSFLSQALMDGKAAVFAWENPSDDHPRQVEITATIRAMTALVDRISSAFPDQPIPNPRQMILQSFREEGYGIVPVWDGPSALTMELRSLAHRMGLPDLPAPGSRYVPGETRGKNATWMAHTWASILVKNPGFWERNRTQLVVLPWTELAANSHFDLDTYAAAAVTDIERDEHRYQYAKLRVGEVQDVASRIKRTSVN